MTVGERIKYRRVELNLTVDELAKRLGKNRATIYRYESNDIENFPITVLEPLAKALRTTPSYLMGWEEKEEQNETFSFYLDMQLELLGYRILYDSDGNVTLFHEDDVYEITDLDVKDLITSTSSYIKFKVQEILNKSRKYPSAEKVIMYHRKNDDNSFIVKAAHDRTDIEVTDEMRQYDDDIMNDDSEWE